MKAIYSPIQAEHAPSRFLFRGNIVDYPESPERVARLLDGASRAGLELRGPMAFDRSHLSAVHSERYLGFLEHGPAQWADLPGASAEIQPGTRPVESPAEYPRDIVGRAGWHIMDFSGAVGPATWRSAQMSAWSALTAADLVRNGEDAAYALCRPPGHHAHGERATGFCYLNNAAIVAQYLRGAHDRVAILDVDVHHGNGTQSIFYDRDDVATVSIHGDPADYFPFFYGYATQQGRGAGEGANLNLPLPVGSGDGVWLAALESALAWIGKTRASALVLALGLDAHEADPLKGATVTTAGFGSMAGLIAEARLPTVIVQEGGYMTPFLGDNLAAFLQGFRKARG